ncbi:expressed unknown protein [Seminavis robusta]|uniref:Uncharacterized protein n=1 Tax=Seminavis robusta TaxID=568900 RepID=A0A9N8EYX7_9STRA|nr:expressed unknown protein [Seminavis robusta]|eukprot:Sro2243_g320460.1 n/a (299) ;mRNA; f:9012-9908
MSVSTAAATSTSMSTTPTGTGTSMLGFNNGALQCWNTRAVSRLQSGDVRNCMLIIKNELTCVRANLVKIAADATTGTNGDSSDQEMMMDHQEDPQVVTAGIRSVPLLPQDEEEEDEDEATQKIWECQNNLFSLYPRAFVMDCDDTNEDSSKADSSTTCYVYLSVLLYNLALAHHMEAAQLHKNGRPEYLKSLQNARHLYKSALEVADSSWSAADLEAQRSLLLALLNNLGFISSHTLDFLETRHCMQMMCELMDMETAMPCDAHTSVSDKDFELFFTSVFTYMDAPDLNALLCLAPAA